MGGLNRSTQNSSSGPWSGQQPFLTDVFEGASQLYNTNGPQYYEGPTVAGENAAQRDAYAMTRDRVAPHENALGSYVTGNLRDPGATGGENAAQMATMGMNSGMNGLVGAANPTGGNPWYLDNELTKDPSFANSSNAVSSRLGVDPTAKATLGSMAQGGQNPHLDSMYDSASRKLTENYQDVVNPSLNATFGAAGRTGSGIHKEVAADAGGDYMDSMASLGSSIYGNAYEGDQNRRLSAASSLGSLDNQSDIAGAGIASNMYTGDANRKFGAMGMASDLSEGAADRSLSASNSLINNAVSGVNALNNSYNSITGRQGTAASFAPTVSNMGWENIDRVAGVGDDIQAQAQNLINADVNKWNYNENMPWQLLDMYSNIVQGNNYNVSQGKGSGTGLSVGF